MKADDLLLLFLPKNFFSIWAWSIMISFLCKLGLKKQFLRGFTRFFQNFWIVTQAININCIT